MKLSTGLVCFVALIAAGALPPMAEVAAAAEIGADRDQAFGRNAGVTVKGIRLGRHPDKLRIVLDTTGPLNFDYWISEGGKAIVVLIPQVEWAAAEYLRLGEDSRIYRIRFFPSPSGGGVLSILGREKLGLSAVEEVGPDGNMPYRVVFDIPVRRQDAWIPAGGIMRGGKLLPAHEQWPPVMRAAAGRPLPVITRGSVAHDAAPPEQPVSYANR
ncbi:MAG: hypothetical protein GEU87_17905 [Alphaproteobacteria bacterium]|nr:hypothetical protein [Alphaproteobacteria bacterium]